MAFLKNIVIASMAVAAVSAADKKQEKKQVKKVGTVGVEAMGFVNVGKDKKEQEVKIVLDDDKNDCQVMIGDKDIMTKEEKAEAAAFLKHTEATKKDLDAARDFAVKKAERYAAAQEAARKEVKGDKKFEMKEQVVVIPGEDAFIYVKPEREESCCECGEADKTRQTYADVPCCVDPASACACYAANGCCSCCECWSPYYWFFRCWSNESDSCCASEDKEHKKIHTAAKVADDHISSRVEKENFELENQFMGVNHKDLTKEEKEKYHATTIRVTDYYTVQREVEDKYYENTKDYPNDYFVPCYCSPSSTCGCYAYNGCCSSCKSYENYYTVGHIVEDAGEKEFKVSEHYKYTVDKSYMNQEHKDGQVTLAYDYNSSCCGTTKSHHKEHEKHVKHDGKHMIATKLTQGVTMYSAEEIPSKEKIMQIGDKKVTELEFLEHYAKIIAGQFDLKKQDGLKLLLAQLEKEEEDAFHHIGAWMNAHEHCYMQWADVKISHTEDFDFKKNFLQRVVPVKHTTPTEYVIMREEYISKDAKHHDAEMPCCMDPNGSCGNYAYNGGCACCGCYEDVYVAVDQEALGHQKKEESCCSCSSEKKEKKTHLRGN